LLHRGRFPAHSGRVPELPNPFHGAEFSRLRQALSICRTVRNAMFIGEIHTRLCRRRSNNARTTRSSRNLDQPQAAVLGVHRTLPRRVPQLLALAGEAQLFSVVRPARRTSPSPRLDHHFCVSTNLRFPLVQHRSPRSARSRAVAIRSGARCREVMLVAIRHRACRRSAWAGGSPRSESQASADVSGACAGCAGFLLGGPAIEC
jgi:hypothetical protein